MGDSAIQLRVTSKIDVEATATDSERDASTGPRSSRAALDAERIISALREASTAGRPFRLHQALMSVSPLK